MFEIIHKSSQVPPESVSSGLLKILIITVELGMILENILRRVVVNILIKKSSSNIFPTILSTGKYHQNCQAAFGCLRHAHVRMT